MVSNLRKNFLSIVWHQKPTVVKVLWILIFATSRKCKLKHTVQRSETDFVDWNLWKTKIFILCFIKTRVLYYVTLIYFLVKLRWQISIKEVLQFTAPWWDACNIRQFIKWPGLPEDFEWKVNKEIEEYTSMISSSSTEFLIWFWKFFLPWSNNMSLQKM